MERIRVQEATDPEGNDRKEAKNNGHRNTDSSGVTTPLREFQQLSSSKNAFTRPSGFYFPTSFWSIPRDCSAVGIGSGSLFGLKIDKTPALPSFNFSAPAMEVLFLKPPGISCWFPIHAGGVYIVWERIELEPLLLMLCCLNILMEVGGSRRKGELKVNASIITVERARRSYRLILNASSYADMKLTNMDKRGSAFACMNSIGEGKFGLSTFALKFKDGSRVEELCPYRCSEDTRHSAKILMNQ